MILILPFAGCSKDLPPEGHEKNITFTAVIDEVYESGILVKDVSQSSQDNVSFDKAVVQWTEDTKPDFALESGQKVKITVLPQIRESYPVQTTLVGIKLAQ